MHIETRSAIASINANDDLRSLYNTSAFYQILLGFNFKIPIGKINVIAPPIGGGFEVGRLQIEALAYILSPSRG